MSAHLVLFDQHKANANGRYALADPGNAGTIGGAHGVDRSPAYCDLVSTGAETRTLGAPTAAGDFVTLNGKTVGGTITVTVTNGYNANGDTTFTITAAKQWYEFVAVWDGTTYYWRLAGSYAQSNSGMTLAAPAAPAAVATATGTAAAAEITATGGVGGGTSIATTGTGGAGGGYTFTGGAGGVASAGATASTGGAGGAFTVTTGAGGAETVAGSGINTGGAGGGITLTAAAGGTATTATGGNVGGAGGAVGMTAGAGGVASGGSDTGGAGGDVTLTAGAGGNGTTGGRAGVITLVTGAVGTGGSPVKGKVLVKMAGTEKFGFYGDGTTSVFTSLGAVPSNVNIDGVMIPKGGVALTDVRNALIDDASGGTGTVSHFIGNQQITTSSDQRLKENVADVLADPLDLIGLAPRLVAFDWNDPADRPGPGNEHGKNSRGQYIGWLAQETIDSFPFAVNAGAGKACPKCRAGKPCDEDGHSFWTVDYQHLVPLLAAGINRLAAKLAALEAKLAGK